MNKNHFYNLNLEFTKQQTLCWETPANEIFFGGAAGGGKSLCARYLAIIYAAMIPGLQVYFFRRIRKDLIKNHVEGPRGFRALLKFWIEHKYCELVADEIRFKNGSKIYLCHCQHAKDRYNYQGAEIHFLIVEEATQFTAEIYKFLRSRVRIAGIELPEKFRGKFPMILSTSNPGNVGHSFFKETFVDHGPYSLHRAPADEGGMLQQYIPAQLEDNPFILKDDPLYEARLSGMGSKELVQAFRYGNWDIIAGAFFDEFSLDAHVIKPFSIPEWWYKMRSFDWGSASPFSHGWYTISDGSVGEIPAGAIIKFREWYGATSANKGLKLPNREIARGVKDRELPKEVYTRSVADRKFFVEDGGPAIAEDFRGVGLNYGRADDRRIPGWQQLRQRLVGDNGKPMLYFFETCKDTIRTLPLMQHSEHDPEELMDGLEDHAIDELRYACMCRPYIIKEPINSRELRKNTLRDLDDDFYENINVR